MNHQDWNQVVICGKQAPEKPPQQTVKRVRGDGHLRKLDNDTETLKHNTVSLTLAQTIQNARNEKGWTRAELAQRVQLKVNVITEYETGRAIPDGTVLQKLSKALGIILRKRM